MHRIYSCLAVSFLIVTADASEAQESPEWQGKDYNLTMVGALINDHCGRVWQSGEYISIHACNYQLANQFSVVVSAQHFDECTVLASGDIIMIADCMVERFNSWLIQQEK